MVKLTAPFLSLDARGSVGSAITFSFWRGINYGRARVIPQNPKSDAQVNIRLLISDATVAWKTNDTVGAIEIDAAYKLAYDNAAAGKAYSGFNLFIKQTVALNYTGTAPTAYDETLAIPASPTS